MPPFSYDSDLIGGSLQVRESRIIACLLLKNPSPDEWHQAIIANNLLQKRTHSTAKRIAQSIRKRLERLEPEFWRVLYEGDNDIATQVAFCATLDRNLLLVEFMESVVQDAYLTHLANLNFYQWDEFLSDRANKDTAILRWTASSRKKMGQVVFRILAEMGYVENKRALKLQPVVIRPEVYAMLINYNKRRLLDCMRLSCRSSE